jgi:GNAT superfamily N-acetyltransferase
MLKVKIRKYDYGYKIKFILSVGKREVAFADLYDYYDRWCIKDLCVEEKYRRKGLAKLLLKRIIEEKKYNEFTLDAEPDEDEYEDGENNIKLRDLMNFYRSMGFKGRSRYDMCLRIK